MSQFPLFTFQGNDGDAGEQGEKVRNYFISLWQLKCKCHFLGLEIYLNANTLF